SAAGCDSTLYTGPFAITASTTVKTIACVDGVPGESRTVGFTSDADFHPGKVTNLTLWWRADAGVPTDAGDLWRDQSGQGNNGVQSFSGSTPRLAPEVVNGLPAMRFDGGD